MNRSAKPLAHSERPKPYGSFSAIPCFHSLRIALRVCGLWFRVYGCRDAFVEEGTEVLVSVAEHHANLVPWQELAKRKKARLRFIPVYPKP